VDAVTLRHAGADRRYLLFRPPAGPEPPAVAVFLHGTGGTADWAADEVRLPAFAAARGFALAVPEGLPPDSARPIGFLSNPPLWNDGSPGVIASAADDVGFLSAVVADALARAGSDPRRVYLSGFSKGAAMAFRFAAARADLLAAVAPVAGYCPPVPMPSRPVPTLYVIGDADPLLPLAGGEARLPWATEPVRRPPVRTTLERWAAAIGCDPVPRVESDAGGVRVEVFPSPVGTEFRAVTVAGLGHHWPGGRGRLNPRIGGRPSDRLDANALVWDFFRRHRL
jgi:polyhydroxybutyrate depolymerase